MARQLAKSVAAAEKRALNGENESQESLEAFEMHRLNHAVGLRSSSPIYGELLHGDQSDAIVSNVEVKKTKSQISKSVKGFTKKPQNASDALVEPNAIDSSMQPSRRRPQSLDLESFGHAPVPVQLIPCDATSAVERSSQLGGDDGPPTLPPPSIALKETEKMSSDSPTQSNDGRSYEQYTNGSSQQLQSSSQASNAQEHSTLQEHDTGFLNFKQRTPYDIPESLEEDTELNFARDLAQISQQASQAPETDSPYAIAPETPAIGRGLFNQGGQGTVLPPSQLFGQTQYTSAIKKASPTSSRPSPDAFNHNSISQNRLESSPLKHKGLLSSPPDVFASSPALPGDSSRPSDDRTPSAPTNSRDDDNANQESVADTPVPFGRRRKPVLEPISEYKSWKKPSTETSKASSQGDEEQDSDPEVDAAAMRRRRARLKQEKASKSLPSIGLPQSSSRAMDSVEVPSTNKSRRIQKHKKTDADQYLAQCHGEPATDKDASQETVADSQEVRAQPQHVESDPKASGESDDKLNAIEDQVPDLPIPEAPLSNPDFRETIPETSPVSTSIQPPRLIGDIMREQSSAVSGLDTVSFPTLSGFTNSAESEQPKEKEDKSSSLPEQVSSNPTNRKHESSRNQAAPSPSPSVVMASSPQSVIRRSTRLGKITTPSSTGQDLAIPSQPGSRTSTLTSLSATPSIASSITPGTEPDMVPETTRRKSSSPAVTKPRRRGRPPPSSVPSSLLLPKPKSPTRSRERSRRLTRHNSMSTDELAGSPLSTSNKEELKPTRKLGRHSLASQHLVGDSITKRGVFHGMVFVLSFQTASTRKSKDKAADRNAIERMIQQEGGKVLEDGFDELFSFDPFLGADGTTENHTLSSSLTLLNRNTGFTALIADAHSRKVKYMQALALGIPCLAPKWITTCIAKGEIVDWTSYLLCAGPSALLGEAIRSRDLQSFDASTAKLVDIVNNRPKLLEEARILLVMKTRNEGKRMPYVFLARVLGGSLVRVNSLEAAKAKLREGESQDQPFDWVYVDDNLHNAQRALFGPNAGDTAPKKRKRQDTSTENSDRPPKKIRTLDDELVIQSLILGRLIEDGEMDEQ